MVSVPMFTLVHKRMLYIRTNLQMLQHLNVEYNIRMFILRNKMMYFGDFVVLVCYISNKFIISANKHEYLMVFIEKLSTLYACCCL